MTSVHSSDLHITEEVALPRALVDAHREGNLVIFVGAGASMDPPANLPSFKKLARDLACLAAVPFSERFVDDQGCSRMQEPRELDRFLGSFPRDFDLRRHALKFVSLPEANPNATHKAVVRLAEAGGVSRIVTTNYDDLLSIAAAEATGMNIERWDAPSLPDGGDFAGIVHLHGSVRGDYKGIVLTDEDFGNAYLSNGWATRFLVPMFRHYTVLFIGYSLGDLIMRYLRRGMSEETCCYALVPEKNAKSADWERLGVTPVGYPVRDCSDRDCPDGSQDHGSLVEALQKWASFAEAGSKEHKARVGKIVGKGPQALGVVDRDYLILQLADLNGAKYFKDVFQKQDIDATRAWGWLEWVAANVPAFQSAFVGERTSEAVDVLLEWYCSCFIADPELHGAALHIAFEHGLTFNDKLFERANVAVWKLSEVDAEAGNRWKALLLSSVRRRGADEMALPIEPYQRGQKVEGLLALAEMTLPRLKRRLDCNFGQNEEIPSTPRCELTWDVRSEILSEHLSEAVYQKPAADPQLGVVLENALVQCYQLLVPYRGDCGDPLSVQRSAIEKHEQDKFNNQLGAIIDAIRDYGIRAQKGGIDQAERWWSLEGILFRRLAIHLVVESERSVNDKIAWLLDHVDLHDYGCRHEIYHLLQETVKNADAETRARVLEAASKTPASDEDEDDRAVGVVGNLLHWLVQCDENWKEACGALEHFQSQHPEFEVSEHPDFTRWFVELGPMSEEQFQERFKQEHKDLGQEPISYQDDELNMLVRQDICKLVQNASARDTQASKFLSACRGAEEMGVACSESMTNVWARIDNFDKEQDQLRFARLIAFVVSFGGLPSEEKSSLLSSSVLAESGNYRVLFAEATRELLECCDPDDVKKVWDGWLHDHITQRLDGVPREARPDEIAAWADIVPFLRDQIGEGLKLFERKDVALYKEKRPYRIPETVPQEHVDGIVAFYARRIKSTRPINVPLSQLKALIDRFEMVFGTEAVKPLRDACDDAGFSLLASRS